MTTPIPSPPSIPFLGHAQSIDRDVPILSYKLLSQQYGEVFELNLAGMSYLSFHGVNIPLITIIFLRSACHYYLYTRAAA